MAWRRSKASRFPLIQLDLNSPAFIKHGLFTQHTCLPRQPAFHLRIQIPNTVIFSFMRRASQGEVCFAALNSGSPFPGGKPLFKRKAIWCARYVHHIKIYFIPFICLQTSQTNCSSIPQPIPQGHWDLPCRLKVAALWNNKIMKEPLAALSRKQSRDGYNSCWLCGPYRQLKVCLAHKTYCLPCGQRVNDFWPVYYTW